ncbi:MAG: glycoside hydrolase family 32 protein [Balneolaceae bacterium]
MKNILFKALLTCGLLFIVSCDGNEVILSENNSEAESENYKENYRPQFHFTPENNWMNDPNGLVYYDGEYHLFYQYNPFGNQWGHMSWGHAVSEDLVHWEHLPVALKEENNIMIFSGSAVIDHKNSSGLGTLNNPPMVAIYTGNHTDKRLQDQRIAYSLDKGRTWAKFEGNPVIDENMGVFRDPKVMWYEPRQKWIQSVAAGDRIKIYSSDNLIDWDFESDFGPNVTATNGVWECPDLFYIKTEDGDGKWVMIVSHGGGINDGPNGGSSTQYYIGDFDGHSFTPEHQNILWLDFGIDNYAGITWSNIPEEDGRRIHIGWMGNWYYASSIPEYGWRGSMTFPREVTLQKSSNRYFLAFNPVRELEDQLGSQETYNEVQASIQLKDNAIIKTGSYRVKTELNLSQVSNMSLTLGSMSERLTLYYDKNNEKFILRRSASGVTDFNELFRQDIEAGFSVTGETLPLEILVDQTSIEVFINNGEKVMTATFFPRYKYSNLEIKSSGGSENSGLVQSVQLDEIKKTVNHTY